MHGINFPVIVKQDTQVVNAPAHVLVRPRTFRTFCREHLQAMVVHVDKDIETTFMVTDGRCPDTIAINAFFTLQMELRTHIQLIENISHELPVHQILGTK